MCGRYTLRTPAKRLAEFFDLPLLAELKPRYNIAPTQLVLTVRLGADQQRQWATVRWGLLPSWVNDPAELNSVLINARSETVDRKPAFRSAFRQRRCLIPADGFFEWQRRGRTKKQPYYIRRKDDQPMAFAGIWERWSQDGVELESCAILTTDANEVVRPLHDRMPVILPKEAWDVWLSPGCDNPAALRELLRPAPADQLEAYPVATIVNRSSNDVPACIEPLGRRDTLF